MGENGAADAAAVLAPRLPLGKDVSVGEYDSVTGLTHVTRQRGRLHFNMGANAIKQAHAAAAARARSEAAEGQQDAERRNPIETACHEAYKLLAPRLRTGMFTGLALYPEEAYYLLQRGALIIYKLEPSSSGIRATADGNDDHQELQPLSVTHFVVLLLRNQRASLACLDVYVFLKENKFHPRRHQEDAATTMTLTDERDATVASPSSTVSLSTASHSQPQHYSSAAADASCRFAFNVWKSSTETVYIPNEDHKPAALDRDAECDVKADDPDKSADPYGNAEERCSHEAEAPVKPSSVPPRMSTPYVKRKKDTSVKKRKVKRLRLVFRVVVCRFADAMPPPRELAELAAASGSHAPEGAAHVPVKVAVVDQDKSVLFFEVGG